MAKISLEVPDYVHLRLKRKQLDREERGQKINLKELYVELIRKAIADDPTLETLVKHKG